MPRVRVPAGDIAGLSRASGEASRRYGGGRPRAVARALRLRARGAFGYEEALAAGLLDPAMPMSEARRLVSARDTTRTTDRLNPDVLGTQSVEKTILYRHFAAFGVPVPVLHGTIGRHGGWSAASARPLPDEASCAALLAEEAPDELVVRPSRGRQGRGVRVLRREGRELVELGGRRWSPEGLVRELAGDPEVELFVVQERLRDHADLAAISDSTVLRPLRATTFVSADGEPRVVHASLDLGVGSANGVRVEVDVDGGRLLQPSRAAGTPLPGIEGRAVPLWDDAAALARRAATLLLPQRTIAFDIALTPAGPVLLDADRSYDPFPSARFGDAIRGIQRSVGS